MSSSKHDINFRSIDGVRLYVTDKAGNSAESLCGTISVVDDYTVEQQRYIVTCGHVLEGLSIF